MDKYSVRTDLASEAIKDFQIPEEEKNINGIELKRVFVDEENSGRIGKKPGVYYTIDTRAIETHDNDDIVNCENVLANVIKEVMEFENIKNEDKGLILGPLVVDNVIVTRHMFMINPSKVSPGIREVSAIAPGVMGTTGIETFDIIEAVKSKIDVDYMIVVDALASRSIDRVNKTIQITNTGISPGSGVGNRRKELSKETIGIPVIAIGVPTVVDAVTITSDTIDIIMKYMNNLHRNKPEEIDIENTPRPNKEYREELFGNVGALSEEEKRQLIDEILTPTGFNMMVTPKEVDLDISDLTQIISKAIDQALHPIVGTYEA